MNTDRIDSIIEKHNREPGSLIQILLDIQEEFNRLPGESLKRISERINVPLHQVRHAATFYRVFGMAPHGRHQVHVCMGTACHVRGAARILDSIEQVTGVKPGETDPGFRFSIDTVNCLGCCAMGPVVRIDDRVYGKMTPAGAAEIIKGCK